MTIVLIGSLIGTSVQRHETVRMASNQWRPTVVKGIVEGMFRPWESLWKLGLARQILLCNNQKVAGEVILIDPFIEWWGPQLLLLRKAEVSWSLGKQWWITELIDRFYKSNYCVFFGSNPVPWNVKDTEVMCNLVSVRGFPSDRWQTIPQDYLWLKNPHCVGRKSCCGMSEKKEVHAGY